MYCNNYETVFCKNKIVVQDAVTLKLQNVITLIFFSVIIAIIDTHMYTHCLLQVMVIFRLDQALAYGQSCTWSPNK